MAQLPKIRFDDSNRQWLEAETERTGKTLTRVVNEAVALAAEDVDGERLLQCLALPRVVRLRSTSTSADVARLCTLFQRKAVRRILFAAKENVANGAVLMAVVEMVDLTVLVDNTEINHARRARSLEVRELFQCWDRCGLQDKTVMAPERYPLQSDDLPVEQAEAILSGLPDVERFDLAVFLRLLGAGEVNLKHYQADSGYKVRLFRVEDNSLDAPDDEEPVYEESWSDEAQAQSHFDAILDASDVADSGGQYSLLLTSHGRVERVILLHRFVLP